MASRQLMSELTDEDVLLEGFEDSTTFDHVSSLPSSLPGVFPDPNTKVPDFDLSNTESRVPDFDLSNTESQDNVASLINSDECESHPPVVPGSLSTNNPEIKGTNNSPADSVLLSAAEDIITLSQKELPTKHFPSPFHQKSSKPHVSFTSKKALHPQSFKDQIQYNDLPPGKYMPFYTGHVLPFPIQHSARDMSHSVSKSTSNDWPYYHKKNADNETTEDIDEQVSGILDDGNTYGKEETVETCTHKSSLFNLKCHRNSQQRDSFRTVSKEIVDSGKAVDKELCAKLTGSDRILENECQEKPDCVSKNKSSENSVIGVPQGNSWLDGWDKSVPDAILLLTEDRPLCSETLTKGIHKQDDIRESLNDKSESKHNIAVNETEDSVAAASIHGQSDDKLKSNHLQEISVDSADFNGRKRKRKSGNPRKTSRSVTSDIRLNDEQSKGGQEVNGKAVHSKGKNVGLRQVKKLKETRKMGGRNKKNKKVPLNVKKGVIYEDGDGATVQEVQDRYTATNHRKVVKRRLKIRKLKLNNQRVYVQETVTANMQNNDSDDQTRDTGLLFDTKTLKRSKVHAPVDEDTGRSGNEDSLIDSDVREAGFKCERPAALGKLMGEMTPGEMLEVGLFQIEELKFRKRAKRRNFTKQVPEDEPDVFNVKGIKSSVYDVKVKCTHKNVHTKVTFREV